MEPGNSKKYVKTRLGWKTAEEAVRLQQQDDDALLLLVVQQQQQQQTSSSSSSLPCSSSSMLIGDEQQHQQHDVVNFYGPNDFRSPGSQWARGPDGRWRAALFQNNNSNNNNNAAVNPHHHQQQQPQVMRRGEGGGWRRPVEPHPYVNVVLRGSRECKPYVTMGSFLAQFDFAGSAENPLRYLYITRLVKQLFQRSIQIYGIGHSGTLQRELLSILEVLCVNVHQAGAYYQGLLYELLRFLRPIVKRSPPRDGPVVSRLKALINEFLPSSSPPFFGAGGSQLSSRRSSFSAQSPLATPPTRSPPLTPRTQPRRFNFQVTANQLSLSTLSLLPSSPTPSVSSHAGSDQGSTASFGCPLLSLPPELLVQIMCFLPSHHDLVNLGATCRLLHSVSLEPLLWKYMCLDYFPQSTISRAQMLLNTVYHWRAIFDFALREYNQGVADQVVLCTSCGFMQWRHSPHPHNFGSGCPSFVSITPSSIVDQFAF